MIETALAAVITALAWLAWEGGGMLAEVSGLDELWPLIQAISVLATFSAIDWLMRRM